MTWKETFNLPKSWFSPLPDGHSNLYMTNSQQDAYGILKVGKFEENVLQKYNLRWCECAGPLGLIH